MNNDAVAAPPLDADAIVLTDWLELAAFFDVAGRARLDEIDNALDIQDEEDVPDVAAADAGKDDRRAAIEEEVLIRSGALGEAYPFELSDDGEELRFRSKAARRASSFYLNCLLISHFTRSAILIKPPGSAVIAEVRRKHFQTLSTLAVAGFVDGPAVSFGWPRQGGASISAAIGKCCVASGTGTARVPPGPEASDYAKDGGIDVIGWKVAVNGLPPPSEICFGQAASGHRWSAKSAADDLEQFFGGFWTDRPACNATTVTIVPFRLEKRHHDQYGRRHGHILDRLRTPIAALRGFDLATRDGVSVDGAASAARLSFWLGRYRASV